VTDFANIADEIVELSGHGYVTSDV
jgi:hypothetical protein